MQKKYFNSQDARNLINIYGFSIFPIHGIKDDGGCTCNNINCKSIGKHPATPDGFKSASKDIEHVKKLWSGRAGLNVGIATGAPSGVFVIDIDNETAEKELYKKFNIPKTYTVKTGRGKHLYFKYNPNKIIHNSTHIIDGVDVRGDGGYVAGAGSNHANGTVYECLNPLEQFADCPDDLFEFCSKKTILPLENSTKTTLYNNTKDGWTIEQVKDHLEYINPDCDYDTWVKIGMALHAEGLPFHLFDDWSKRGIKYDNSTRDHWKSFTADGGVTYGTVVALAKQGGWQFKRESVTVPAAPIKEIINSETGEILEDKKRQIPFIYADDISTTLDTKDFVESLLRENEFSVTYGESNCGKTFFMLDLAMHVALGKKWRGLEVEQGGVIYAALEGGHGTKNRIMAFKEYHKVNEHIPLAIIPSSLNFLDVNGDLTALVEGIKQEKDKLGGVKLIVIDTLARAISGGDENSSMDMGQLIINADILRSLTGAHINFIHHSGKNAAKGARGHSSLRAAVDTEIEISRDNANSPSLIKIVKQREMEMIDDMAFTLSSIVLGVNRRGKEVTSCVAIPSEIVPSVKTITMNPTQTFVYDALIGAIDAHGQDRIIYKDTPPIKCVSYDELRLVLENKGYKKFMETEKKTTAEQIKSATQTARLGLKKMGKINFDGNYIWINYE